MSAAELDAEFLTRIEPSRLKDLAAFNTMAWYGYRFMHPGLRVYLYTHHYKRAYQRTGRILGKKFALPKFMQTNPFVDAKKADITGLVTGTFHADAHGIPYDLWCDVMMEQCLRSERAAPLQPVQMYHERYISLVIDKWAERNQSGIYLARAPQLKAVNYQAHPWQDAYYNHLCDIVAKKGNRAFWLGRLIHTTGQLDAGFATARFGAELVEEAEHHK